MKKTVFYRKKRVLSLVLALVIVQTIFISNFIHMSAASLTTMLKSLSDVTPSPLSASYSYDSTYKMLSINGIAASTTTTLAYGSNISTAGYAGFICSISTNAYSKVIFGTNKTSRSATSTTDKVYCYYNGTISQLPIANGLYELTPFQNANNYAAWLIIPFSAAETTVANINFRTYSANLNIKMSDIYMYKENGYVASSGQTPNDQNLLSIIDEMDSLLPALSIPQQINFFDFKDFDETYSLKTVTITNKSKQSVTLNTPYLNEGTNFNLYTSNMKTVLGSQESTSISVAPKSGIAAQSSYSDIIKISTTNNQTYSVNLNYSLRNEPQRVNFDLAWQMPTISDGPVELAYNGQRAIYYKGMDYNGHTTNVFAYIGFPQNIPVGQKVPAVVLVHGGGGTAYPQFVKMWNDRGYAAIAMDLEGHQPTAPEAGPTTVSRSDSGPTKNFDLSLPIEQQWMYHAVSDVYLAHTILANDSRVDSSKIGVSGISWGGVVTSVALSNTNKFAFAIPVYGAGYMDKSVAALSYTKDVTQQWDAANWLKTVTTPTLWLNGDSDFAFSINMSTLCSMNTNQSLLTIIPSMKHGHSYGWARNEIYDFADSIVKGSSKLVTITKQPKVDDLSVEFNDANSNPAVTADLYYSNMPLEYGGPANADGSTIKNVWLKKSLTINNKKVIVDLPQDAVIWYVNITDSKGNVVSTNYSPFSIKNLQIKTPALSTYIEGQVFNPLNLILTATLTDGRTKDITYSQSNSSSFGFSKTNALTSADKSITISYGGKTVQHSIMVNQRSIQNISIKSPPTKINYLEGEIFNPAGLVLSLMYDNSEVEDIAYSSANASDFTFNKSTALSVSDNAIIISYNGKLLQQNIMVSKQFTAVFNANGGVPVPTLQQIIEGGKVTQPAGITKIGYSFGGWYTQASCTDLYDFNTVPTSNVNLYAKWTAGTTIVTLNSNQETNETTLVTATYDSEMPIATAPIKTNYTFLGYYDQQVGGIKYYNSNMTGAKKWDKTVSEVTLYAQWVLSNFVVKFHSNGGINTMADQTININIPANLIANAFTKEGYTFSGWATSVNGAKVYNDKALEVNSTTEALDLYAIWIPTLYNINYIINGGTNATSNPTTYTIENPNISIQAATKSGYTFIGWYKNSEFSGNVLKNIALGSTGTITLYAKFAINVNTSISDSSTNITVSGNVPEQTKINIKALSESQISTAYNVVKIALSNIADKFVAFDIKLTIDNISIQPNGNVKLTLPVPEGYNIENLELYYVSDSGDKLSLEFTVNNGMIEFETNHFSTYVITQKIIQPQVPAQAPSNPNTKTSDVTIIILELLVAICGASIMFCAKRV